MCRDRREFKTSAKKIKIKLKQLIVARFHCYVKEVADGEYWYTTPVGEELPDRYNIQREIAMVVEMANAGDVGKYTGLYYTFSMSAQVVTPILSGALLRSRRHAAVRLRPLERTAGSGCR